jgi:hypothetical protein
MRIEPRAGRIGGNFGRHIGNYDSDEKLVERGDPTAERRDEVKFDVMLGQAEELYILILQAEEY